VGGVKERSSIIQYLVLEQEQTNATNLLLVFGRERSLTGSICQRTRLTAVVPARKPHSFVIASFPNIWPAVEWHPLQLMPRHHVLQIHRMVKEQVQERLKYARVRIVSAVEVELCSWRWRSS
jgi:hypothetical protein